MVERLSLVEMLVTTLRNLQGKFISLRLPRDCCDIALITASDQSPRLTATVFAKCGFVVHYYPIPVHTPLVPFGVNQIKAAVGIMITASHNPAQDNGYKVYWENGCQIIPPHDKGIAETIRQDFKPEPDYMTYAEDISSSEVKPVPWNTQSLEAIQDAYFRVLHSKSKFSSQIVPFVYTPMHGVGLPYMQKAISESSSMIVVNEQAKPDPNFPTVSFPNPEEHGALDLAIATANGTGTTVIVATDPDADRLAVAERVDGEWQQFTGNQLGVLLASYILSTYKAEQKDTSKLCMLATTVSTQMLSHIAAVENFRFEETLTGFKWLGNRAIELEQAGYDVRFAFEQAIGYMIPSVVHDKDGIAAASLFLTARAYWSAQGRTPWEQLQALYQKYGYFADVDTYVRSPSPAATKKAFERVRSLGSPYPRTLAGMKILSWRDLTIGFDSKEESNVPVLPTDPETEMITVEVEGNVRVTVRGSGTEPKIKLYVEGRGISLDEARNGAKHVLKNILDEWLPGFQQG
jgi:phosphoglucomutase